MITERPVGRMAFCPTCECLEMADADWRCCWCLNVALTQLNPAEARGTRLFTSDQIVAVHERYARGETLSDLSREHFVGRDTLKQNFWAAGLPTRSLWASNVLIAPRRPKARKHGKANPAYRSDLADEDVVEAYERTRSIHRASLDLGCGVATVHRRLKRIGHPMNTLGTNQFKAAT